VTTSPDGGYVAFASPVEASWDVFVGLMKPRFDD
jgi:hypothetical protein